MGFEGLTELEIIRGFSNIFSMILVTILGILMIRKYFKYKQIELLIMGFNFIGISTLAWGVNLAFIMYVFFSIEISDILYLFLLWGLTGIPFTLWMYVFSRLVYPKWTKQIIIVILIVNTLFEIFIITFLFIEPSMVAVRVALMDSNPSIVVGIFNLLALITTFITFTLFFRDSLNSVEKRIRLKGKFVYIGTILFVISRIIDILVPLNLVMLFLTRSLLTISAILNYIGWVMPDRIAKWFIKEME